VSLVIGNQLLSEAGLRPPLPVLQQLACQQGIDDERGEEKEESGVLAFFSAPLLCDAPKQALVLERGRYRLVHSATNGI
jgi:hypothetical protein